MAPWKDRSIFPYLFISSFGANHQPWVGNNKCTKCLFGSTFLGSLRNGANSRPSFLVNPLFNKPSLVVPLQPVQLPIVAIRHGDKLKKLGKPSDQRKALIRALTTELLRHGRIKTTLARAKVVRKYAERTISLSKMGTLHARRQALGFIYDKQLVHALFEQAPERYAERNGGYTRIYHTMPRQGDNAAMGIIELV
eukprot:jgi/Galph1/79/GphlegSOOS_G4879.1